MPTKDNEKSISSNEAKNNIDLFGFVSEGLTELSNIFNITVNNILDNNENKNNAKNKIEVIPKGIVHERANHYENLENKTKYKENSQLPNIEKSSSRENGVSVDPRKRSIVSNVKTDSKNKTIDDSSTESLSAKSSTTSIDDSSSNKSSESKASKSSLQSIKSTILKLIRGEKSEEKQEITSSRVEKKEEKTKDKAKISKKNEHQDNNKGLFTKAKEAISKFFNSGKASESGSKTKKHDNNNHNKLDHKKVKTSLNNTNSKGNHKSKSKSQPTKKSEQKKNTSEPIEIELKGLPAALVNFSRASKQAASYAANNAPVASASAAKSFVKGVGTVVKTTYSVTKAITPTKRSDFTEFKNLSIPDIRCSKESFIESYKLTKSAIKFAVQPSSSNSPSTTFLNRESAVRLGESVCKSATSGLGSVKDATKQFSNYIRNQRANINISRII